MREIIHINYSWLFNKEFKEDHFKTDKGMDIVNIPHTVYELPLNNFDERLYQTVSSYKKVLNIDEKYSNKRIYLNFDGVMAYSEVYINESLVVTHKGGYTPFKVDITDYITLGVDFTLFVKVDSTERSDIPPFGFVIDYLTYGGIYREVYLEIVEETFIDKAFIKTNVTNNPKLDVKLFINNPTNKEEDIKFKLLYEGRVIKEFKKKVTLLNEVNIKEDVDNVKLWDLDNPNLYMLEISLLNDLYIDRFGFREVKLDETGFYLNGKYTKIIGLNRHQSYPYVGYAMPKNAQKKDADILKFELGVNTVRSSHYPPSKHFLDRCDEIGLLVFNEIPGWQHIGDKDWQEVAIKNVEEMIYRDFNHPSIFIWGVRINESIDNDEFYSKTNNVARSLDDTRPTGGVRFTAKSNLLEDVYTVNDFLHRGNNAGLTKPKKMVGKTAPYLVTEYNGHMFPTKKFDDELHRIEHAYRHLRVQEDSFKYSESAGAIGWCMFDYNTHKDFGSGDKICYHGVMDIFRIPKYAASVYASQSNQGDVLEVLSSMNGGEYPATEIPPITVFTNCDYIKFYKNGNYINTFYKNRKDYPNIPNPPIIVDDFIGDLIEQNEKFSKRDALKVKNALNAVVKYGEKNLPIKHKFNIGLMIMKYKLKRQDLYNLFGKYVGNWGDESINFTFKGYKDDLLVKSVTKAPVYKPSLEVSVDSNNLYIEDTYDVTRVIVRLVDEHKNDLTYAFDPINLTANNLEVIGPKTINLIGGSVGFWVKTIEKGQGNVVLKSSFGEKLINFDIK